MCFWTGDSLITSAFEIEEEVTIAVRASDSLGYAAQRFKLLARILSKPSSSTRTASNRPLYSRVINEPGIGTRLSSGTGTGMGPDLRRKRCQDSIVQSTLRAVPAIES
jgi:hypothetical protein